MGESKKNKDELLARLAVERGYVTGEQLEEARAARRTAEEMAGVEIDLAQVLLNKQFLTPEQMQDIDPEVDDEAEPLLAEPEAEAGMEGLSAEQAGGADAALDQGPVDLPKPESPPEIETQSAPAEAALGEGPEDASEGTLIGRGRGEGVSDVAAEDVETETGPGEAAQEAETEGGPATGPATDLAADVAAVEEEPTDVAALQEAVEALKAEVREKDEALAELGSINVALRAEADGNLGKAKAAASEMVRYRQEAEQAKAQFSLKDQLIKQLLTEEKGHKEVARERETLAERMDNLTRRAAEAEALKAELEIARREAARADELERQLGVLGARAAEAQALKAELARSRQQLARAAKLARQFRELRTRLAQEAAEKKEAQEALVALKALKVQEAAEAKAPPRPPKRKAWSESEIDELFGRLAVGRGYLSREDFDQARRTRKRARNATGVDVKLTQILVSNHQLTPDQAQDIQHEVARQTGEARLIAGYEVVAKLGQGGMGAVYKARSLDTGEFVALKILPPSIATKDLIARFRRESMIVQGLDHENIVGCVEFDYDKKKKCYFSALEFIEGENLEQRVEREGVLSEDEAISITHQIARALQHAHFNELVHRDVKPANVMVTPDGTGKLLDLGLARPANMEVTRLTKSGVFVGSPHFASPEQAKSSRELDIRSDIYSLGATLYYMITGSPPFDGETDLMILQQHVYETLTWPADVNPEISDELCLIVSKMMAKDPADRYQKPLDLIRDLDGLEEGRGPEVTEEVMRTSSIQPAVRPRAERGRPRPARSRDRRERARPASEHGRRKGRQTTSRIIPADLPTVPVAIALALLVLMLVAALVKAFVK